MPRPANVSRVSLRGHLPTGEIFDTSIWVAGAPASQSQTDDFCGVCVTTFQNSALATLKADLAVQSGYDSIAVYSYPTGGTAGAAFVSEQAITGGAGTSNSGNGLDTSCLVLTTLTGAAGRRNRGRMYLPANGVGAAAGLCDGTVCDNIVSAMGEWFGALADPAVGNHAPVVVSVVGSTSRTITGIRCDNKFDLQRRRSNALVASHTASGGLT